jgi:hypothetical protein
MRAVFKKAKINETLLYFKSFLHFFISFIGNYSRRVSNEISLRFNQFSLLANI